MIASKIKLKEIFEVDAEYGSFYTGGTVAWHPDGTKLFCQNETQIKVINVDSVTVESSFGIDPETQDPDTFVSFALSPDGESIVSTHAQSGLLRLWETSTGKLKKMWKSLHQGPCTALAIQKGCIASGGADSLVRLWDTELQVCKGTLRDCGGIINLLVFHPDGEHLIGACRDNKIYCWNVESRTLVKRFEAHYSDVTSVAFEGTFMVSAGRDKVIILWDFKEGKQIRTIPVYEAIEAVEFLPAGITLNGITLTDSCVAVVGEEGTIKIWDVKTSKIIFKQKDSLISKSSQEGGLAVTNMLLNKVHNQVAVVSVDHNIIVHELNNEFKCIKQLVGYFDEVLDMVLFNKNKFLAMVTNSNDIKLYQTDNMSCQLLRGHSDIVLSVAAKGNILISSSKDCSVKVWRIEDDATFVLLGTGTRHTAAVGAVDLSKSQDFFASASQDKTIRLWKIPSEVVTTLGYLQTQLAHDKDINSIAIAPNNKLLATGSQDKTAKLWDASDLTLVGVLRGHTRGIWSVTFSTVDQILLTTAADSTMRLWSLTDLSCLKTFEGHESSVLRAEFISDSMQIVSTGSDGLMKIWNVKTSECMKTLDKHEARIWALAVSDGSVIYTGGADSLLVKWRDVTEERRDEELKKFQETALQEQQLSNLIQQKKMLKALRMALKLDRPNTTLKIINAIIRDRQDTELEDTILGLNEALKESLLKHASTWNTNSRNCRPAQLVINVLMTDILSKKLRVTGLGKFLEETMPYTERHYKRMTEYLKDLKFIEYTLKNMQPHTQEIEAGDVEMKSDSDSE